MQIASKNGNWIFFTVDRVVNKLVTVRRFFFERAEHLCHSRQGNLAGPREQFTRSRFYGFYDGVRATLCFSSMHKRHDRASTTIEWESTRAIIKAAHWVKSSRFDPRCQEIPVGKSGEHNLHLAGRRQNVFHLAFFITETSNVTILFYIPESRYISTRGNNILSITPSKFNFPIHVFSIETDIILRSKN